MSLTSGTSTTQPLTNRPMPGAATVSTSWTTSSSSTISVSTSASASYSSSSSTTSTSSTQSVNRIPPTTQSPTGLSTTTTSLTASSTTNSQTSTTQSSASESTTVNPRTSATATTSLSFSNSTVTPLPSTRQHGTIILGNSTSLVATSSYEVPLTSSNQVSNTQSLGSTQPTTTSEPEPTLTSAPETAKPATHRLIIDLGDCAGFTSPGLSLERGELGDLVAIGDGRFAIELKAELDTGLFGVTVSLQDDGVRCGKGGQCTAATFGFQSTSGIDAYVLRAGDYGLNMYPFSIWLEDGVTAGAHLADSPENMYHCWGWTEEECPYTSTGSGDDIWALSSENPTGTAYIGFCPSDGPKWSTVPENPNPPSFTPTHLETYIILPTQTVLSVSTFLTVVTPTKLSAPVPTDESCDASSTCSIVFNTFISDDVTSTILSEFLTAPADSGSTHTTAIILHTTSTVPATTLLSKPTPTITSWLVESTDVKHATIHSDWSFSTLTAGPRTRRPTATASSGSNTPISTPVPTVVPTYSDITLGSVVSTLSYDVTVMPSPAPTTTSAPDSQYVITSWTTWMTVNGSTVPAIAGEVGVLSTIPITYMLEPSTIVPVAEISSRSVQSTRSVPTSSPSPTVAASSDQEQTRPSQAGKIAGAVVGSLVGLVLGSLLLWYICYRRRRRQRRDYFARGDPAWLSPRHENRSGGASGLLVDLDEEPRMRDSYVEPWVPPRPSPQSSSRGKPSRPEMESVSGVHVVSRVAGPSREPETSSNEGGTSWFQHESSDSHNVFAAVVTRPSKTVMRGEPTRRPDVGVSQQPVPSHYRNPSLANPSLSLLPTPFQNEPPSPITPPSPPSRAALIPNRVSPPPRAGPSQRRYLNDEEQLRHDAIPPLYNEAWNTGR